MRVIKKPAPSTLRTYGLTLELWEEMLAAQGGVCALCGRVPKSGKLAIDHAHVKRWRHLPPAERRKYVRGLVCHNPCNAHHIARNNAMSVKQLVAYFARISVVLALLFAACGGTPPPCYDQAAIFPRDGGIAKTVCIEEQP